MGRAAGWMAVLLLLTLCLCACEPGLRDGVSTDNTTMPIIAPAIDPMDDEETAVPKFPNPVEPFFQGFASSISGMREKVMRAADGNEIHVIKTLQLDSAYQAMQFYFLGLSELLYLDEEEAWTGAIFGGAPGTGVMRAQGDGYAFTVTLADRNRITGTYRNNHLQAEWMRAEDVLITPTPGFRMPDETPEEFLQEADEEEGADPIWETVYHPEKTAALWMDASAYHVRLYGEDGYTCLHVEEERLFYVTGVPAPPEISSPPESWAEWGYADGVLTAYARKTEIPNTTTEEEQGTP